MVTRIDWKNCQSHWTVSTMGINFRALLPFLLFYVFKGSSAQSVVVTYTNKLVETLECSFTSSVTIVQWIDQSDDGNPITVFLYDVSKGLAQKQTNYSKYENFNYAIDGTNGFNLVITNVDRGDGGRYLCNRILPSSFVTFDVTVEVLPESISIDCTEFDCMPSDERQAVPQINCVCTATGLSTSVLEIKWEGVDVSTVSNTARVMDSTPESFSISSNITFRPPDGTFSLSCSLTGYRSQIPESLLRSSTHTFSPPVCNLEHVCLSDGTNASLICSCSNGSPKVKAYSFYNSQKLPIGKQCTSSKSVQVDANKMEMFYCSGHNGVHNQLVEHEFNCKQGSAWWIIIVILLLLVVATIIFVVVKKRWKKYRLSNPGVVVEPVPKQGGGGVTAPLLYKNTSVQDQQKVQGPGGMNTVPSSGGSAPKKNDKEKEGADRDVSKKDPPKEKTGAKVDPSTNLASKSEVTKNELSKKKEEERLETGGSGLETKDNRNKEPFEEGGSGVDPEDYKNKDGTTTNEKLETGGSGLETKDNRNTKRFEEGGSGVDPEDYKNKDGTTTNENSEQATHLSPRTPGDGEPDHAPGFKESANSPGPSNDGLESSVDLIAPGENPAGQQESHDKNGAAAPQEIDNTNNPSSSRRSGHRSISATQHTEVPQRYGESNPSRSHFDDVSRPTINQVNC